MSDDENGLSEEEYDSLLADLEQRAESGEGPDLDEEPGDLDDFLGEIEQETEKGTPTATREPESDELGAEFAQLEEKGELQAPAEADEPASKEAMAGKEGGDEKKGADRGRSRGRKVAIGVLKVVLWGTPAVVLWWLLGTYLGQWISAGWLIGLVGAMFVFGVPVLLRKVVKRGPYRAWLLGMSLVATVALIAPMANLAAQNMSHYGHWPSSAIAEMTGQPADAGFVTLHASATQRLSSLVATTDQAVGQPRQLGTVFPLGMEWPPEEAIPMLDEAENLSEVEELLEQQADEATGEESDDATEEVDDAGEEAVDEADEELQEAVDEAGGAAE